MKDQISRLRDLLPKLSTSDAKFARNLIDSFTRGHLTAAQAPWIAKLIARAENPPPPPPVAQVAVGDFAGVLNLFKAAQQHLKWPKLTLLCEGRKIVLSIAGRQSKNSGAVNVAGEGHFPDREWFGFVTPAGIWEPSFKTSPAMRAAVTALLSRLAAHPAQVAQEYGKLTGNCCFCNLRLSDARSTAAGYGPICAEHFGLKEEWKMAAQAGTEVAA